MLQKLNKKYILTVFVIMILLLSIWLVIYLFPPLAQNLPPLPAHPASIATTKKIYDLGSSHYCEVKPFSQTMTDNQLIYQVNLYPSYIDSSYEMELGKLPKGLSAVIEPAVGKGKNEVQLFLNRAEVFASGSFTVTVAYHEYQPGRFKWLTNYCLFNVNLF